MASLDYQQNNPPDDEDDEIAKKTAAVDVSPESLKQSIQAGQSAIAHEATAGDPNSQLEDPKANYYLQQLKQMSTDPRYHNSQAIREATDRAEQLYNEKANRNEWLGVAQTLGQAIAQFGAARAGIAGGNHQNMAAIQFGPGTDFEGRTDRNFREYQQSLKNALQQGSINEQQFRDQQQVAKEGLSSALREAEEKRKEQGLSDRLATQEGIADKRLAQQSALADSKIERQQNYQSSREDRRQSLADAMEENRQRNLQVKDVVGEQQSLAKQIQAKQQLANALQQEDDLSPNQAKHLQEQYSSLAAKAGVDLAPVLDKYKNESPTRRREILGMGIPGTSTVDKPKAQKTLYDALGLTDDQARFLELKKKKQSLIGGENSDESSDSADNTSPAAAPATQGKVKVRNPNGQVGLLPADQVDEALKHGFTRVD